VPTQPNDEPQVTRRPLIIGEVLFDVYPDGTEVLGGAPFNVAWHLQALGVQPLLITRVGTDRPGTEILRHMREWGMDVGGVQLDPQYPTGQVGVFITDHGPVFDIAADQAYDYLDPDVDTVALAGGPPSLIYHGSLITRNVTSATSVRRYRTRSGAPVFLDVNLRPPWWSKSSLSCSLQGARWVKLNAEELCLLTDLPTDSSRADLVTAAKHFRSKHDLDAVVLTLSEAGAVLALSDETIEARPSTVVCSGDTVGAGDAFSAAFIAGLNLDWSMESTLGRAIDLAAVVCSLKGAVSTDISLYERLQQEWRTQS
jgi:fructokinase